MNTSHNNYDSIEKFIFDEGLRIESLEIKPELDTMFILLNNEHTFIVRLSFYKGLKNANADSLKNFNFIANGTGIHWPELDEDLSLKGFLKDFLRQKVNSEKELVIV